MKLAFSTLTLELKKQAVNIELSGFRYFYGPIGSGKSSIGRLVDYCLGGSVDWTPALQKEFVSATVELAINGAEISLRRDRDAAKVVATWQSGGQCLQVAIPAKKAEDEVIPGTGVEVLSDLLFFLAKEEPPKVRRRKGRVDERLERLSFRDLYRFCYLDQQGMDSDFFRLNSDNYPVKQKSVDAIRYILGYHSENVAELEARLQADREMRIGLQIGANALTKGLREAGFPDAETIEAKIAETQSALQAAKKQAVEAREARPKAPLVDEELRDRARSITLDILASQQQLDDLGIRIADLERHANELEMLSLRFQRTASARAVLAGVQFTHCPRCTQELPAREQEHCRVCDQPDMVLAAHGALDEKVVEQDLKARQSELREALQRLREQKTFVSKRVARLERDKQSADAQLAQRLRFYDSEFLSRALVDERAVATLEQELGDLVQNRRIPALLKQQLERAEALLVEEAKTQAALNDARKKAFRDRRNIDELAALFLDCLTRSRFPDVRATDAVEIDPSTFYPQIPLGGKDGLVVLTFDNAGSGGMMALFRTCFALALHRLSAQLEDSRLPPILVIDTATKNVSSVENPEVISSFYAMVYELATNELAETQFIIIDNELTMPPDNLAVDVKIRHMMRGDPNNPPLVPYLTGDFEGNPESSLGESSDVNADE